MRIQLPEWVSGYVGIPFREQGYDAAGCHCWGLVRLVLSERADIDAPSLSQGYTSSRDVEHINMIIAGESTFWEPVTRGAEKLFDVLTMTRVNRRVRKRIECHVGVVVAPGWMLHIERATKATCECYHSERQARSVANFYRWSHTGCQTKLA